VDLAQSREARQVLRKKLCCCHEYAAARSTEAPQRFNRSLMPSIVRSAPHAAAEDSPSIAALPASPPRAQQETATRSRKNRPSHSTSPPLSGPGIGPTKGVWVATVVTVQRARAAKESGGHGIRTHNRFPDTTIPMWLLANSRTLQHVFGLSDLGRPRGRGEKSTRRVDPRSIPAPPPTQCPTGFLVSSSPTGWCRLEHPDAVT
jgi:hypothetical protein